MSLGFCPKSVLRWLFILNYAIHYVLTERHEGESLFLPDERTSLDDCHLRFYQFNRGGGGGIGGLPATQFEYAHMGAIGWIQPEDGKIRWQCGGSLIWDNFVLTAAHCVVDSKNTPPDVVRFGDLDIFSPVGDEFAQQLKIAEIIRHPSHRFSGHYHDVALIRLEKNVTINKAVLPACLWLDDEVRFKRIHATGWGNVGFDPTYGYIRVNSVIRNSTSCMVGDSEQSKVAKGITEELICSGYDFYILPEMCNLVVGAGMQRGMWRVERDYSFTLGLSQFGRDCGAGEHMIATRLASHAEWLQSILLPKERNSGGNVQFLDTDLHKDDQCETNSNAPGKCVRIEECSDYWNHVVPRGGATFCSTSNVICCPTPVIDGQNAQNGRTELERCPTVQRDLKPLTDNGSLVQIGFDAKGRYDFRCVGSIITTQLILTTASCFGGKMPLVVRLSVNDTIVPIRAKVQHKNFNATDKSNDVAIIQLMNPLVWDSYIFPTCLWMNQTHTPLVMRLIQLDGDSFSSKFMIPQYNVDCQRAHPFRLQRSQLCTREPYFGKTCAMAGDVLRSNSEDDISYLVGLAQPSGDCKSRQYITLTRISQQLEWIKQALGANFWSI